MKLATFVFFFLTALVAVNANFGVDEFDRQLAEEEELCEEETTPNNEYCGTLNSICEGGETCCNGLSCKSTIGSRKICLPPEVVPHEEGVCKGTSGGCGGGPVTDCCGHTLSCQWSPGNHRACLPKCKKEEEECVINDCCNGLKCHGGKCLPKPTGRKCHHPVIGEIEHNDCARTTIYETCVVACCTDGRVNIRYSPLALDMDGSGRVERMSAVDLLFDITGNGKLEDLHEWFAPTEGILVNTNVPGLIITGRHLFGDEGGKYRNGFEKLSLLDEDFDGFVSGREIAGLKLWFDANSNAFLDQGELHSLDEYGVVSLGVKEEKMVGQAIKEDGSKIRMEDLWFEGIETGEDLYWADEQDSL